MKRFFLLSLTFLLCIASSFSQGLELNDKLPTDPNLLTGTLENGLTYYVRANAVPEKRAQFYLVVKVGSIVEDNDQQGLAHFLEHMAFNGTTNFPKNDLVKYLESLGMKFGADVNAYTSFDETVYTIEVPTDNQDFVDKGLLVLFDWAHQVSLDEDEIDAERGVVHEEWRSRQGAADRIMRKMFPVVFYNSRYPERFPIGKMDIIDNCHPDVVRRFYRDWYRPELMAVIVVGDIDAKEIESKIVDRFSKIPQKENPRERINYIIPNHKETQADVASDPEYPINTVQIYYKKDAEVNQTVEYYKDEIISSLFNTMISRRLSELALREDAPFLQAMAMFGGLMPTKEGYINYGIVKNNDFERTIRALVNENQRAKQHGFIETELERAKSELLKSMDKLFNERDKQKSVNYADEYKRNFLPPSEPIPGVETEYKIYNKYVPEITLEEVNAFVKRIVSEENISIFISATETEGVKLPSKEQVIEIFNSASLESVEPYVDVIVEKDLISKLPKKGKIAKVIKHKELDYEVWKLKNGAKVVFKTTDFKSDEILFEARSEGGLSVLDEKDYLNGRLAADVAYESGLGDFDRIELVKYLSGKNAQIYPYISTYREGLTGRSGIADFETLMQMIYVSFTQARVTESAFNIFLNRNKGLIENSKLDPETCWNDSVGFVLKGRKSVAQPINMEMLEQANFRKIRQIYINRFSDPGNFTFYFVGNINKKTFKPFVLQYIASLPMVERTETPKDLGLYPPSGVVNKDVEMGKDPRCVELLVFNGDFEYNLENIIKLNAFSQVLSTRLLEEIREKEGGVYSIGAYPSFEMKPKPKYSVSLYFSCDPEREPELFGKIMAIIEGLKVEYISDIELNKTIEKDRREYQTSIKENSYWKSKIIGVEEGRSTIESYTNYLELLEKYISKESMQESAKRYFDANNYVKSRLLPEAKK